MNDLTDTKNTNFLDDFYPVANDECQDTALDSNLITTAKIGRPKQTWYEKLKSKAVISLTKLEDAEALFISKNTIKNKSQEEADQIRSENCQQLEKANYLLNIENNLGSKNSKELINTKKRLLAVLSDRELYRQHP